MSATLISGPAHRPPKKTAALALAAERRLSRFYDESANRLRPFDLGVSRLLDMLALEREQQRGELHALASAMFGGLSLEPADTRCRRLLSRPLSAHFFVTSRGDAVTLIAQAERLERRTGRFYFRCAAAERYPQLLQLYRHFGACAQRRAAVLVEATEGLALAPHVDPLLA